MAKPKRKAPKTLEETVTKLGQSYDDWKNGEKDKDFYKKYFFAFATEKIAARTLAQKTVVVPEELEERPEAEAYVARIYPTWRLVEFDYIDGDLVAILEEDPAKQEFVFPGSDGRVYKRQVDGGAPMLDDETLKEADPKLWERISREVTTRQIKPLDLIDSKDVAKMQKYMYPAPPTIKLAAPKKVDSDGDA